MADPNSWGLNGIRTAHATIYFQRGEESFRFCPLLQTYSRNQCMLTAELIVDIKGRGYHCPLEWEDDNNGEIQTT